MKALPTVFAVLLALLPAAAQADSWAGAVTREVFSASREFFVRIVPGNSLGDVVGFGSADKGRFAMAEFYRRAPDRSYRLVAATTLSNPVAPVEFFVADSGHLTTLDNWHNLGYDEVVAIYDATGKTIRRYALKDLFLPTEIEKLPHSVSSIRWRQGPTYVRADQKTLLVTVRSGVDFLFGLETGRFVYCEPQAKTSRCRSNDALGRWQPGNALEVTH